MKNGDRDGDKRYFLRVVEIVEVMAHRGHRDASVVLKAGKRTEAMPAILRAPWASILACALALREVRVSGCDETFPTRRQLSSNPTQIFLDVDITRVLLRGQKT